MQHTSPPEEPRATRRALVASTEADLPGIALPIVADEIPRGEGKAR